MQSIKSRSMILDGAHNPAGMQALRESLDNLYTSTRFHFIFACYADKNGSDMLSNLIRSGDKVYLSELRRKRASFSVPKLINLAEKLGVSANTYPTFANALSAAEANRGNNELIVATGSFIVIREIMQLLGWTTVEDGFSPLNFDLTTTKTIDR